MMIDVFCRCLAIQWRDNEAAGKDVGRDSQIYRWMEQRLLSYCPSEPGEAWRLLTTANLLKPGILITIEEMSLVEMDGLDPD